MGAGGVAECHLEAASRHPQANVMYLCDVRLDRALLLAERYGIPEYSADAKRALIDTQVEAVILALPTLLHHEWIVRCTEAGKDILTEKLLCRTFAEARDAIELCEARGIRLAVGYMRRFWPARLQLRSLVQSGALGRPVTWNTAHLEPRSDYYRGPDNWMWDRERGGGITMDGSIHDFDFACWVLGPPHRLYARSGQLSDAVTAPAQGCALVSFPEGDTLVYSGAWQEGDLGTLRPPQSIVGHGARSCWSPISAFPGATHRESSARTPGTAIRWSRSGWGRTGSFTSSWTALSGERPAPPWPPVKKRWPACGCRSRSLRPGRDGCFGIRPDRPASA